MHSILHIYTELCVAGEATVAYFSLCGELDRRSSCVALQAQDPVQEQ